ncbi:hypothetical protein [Flavobacterium sp. LM4]|uniref:hypothetical protein n=1 Tax=Flavobacterium sp. LM4 TaxID=1938609 RepID=UPI000992F85F|nr:hypothetical protein [Flavobacterium sp. LM4]OOV19076.1 hypothetical protein BXU10_05225 [Flavobacterium sp. LM4]
MTEQELEILLSERCKTLDLKRKAFESLDDIFTENSNDKDFLGGFERTEIKPIFDGFKYQTDRRHGSTIIRTRIGLYVENQNWLENIEQIGYYEFETDLYGEVLDDWFVIEEEKFLKDIGIISHFQSMNKKLPVKYLRRNHLQYEFVTYISLVGTLFMSKEFEGAGRFVQRAYTYLETKSDLLDKDYLKDSKKFLKMIKEYLLGNELVSEKLKEELTENKNCG